MVKSTGTLLLNFGYAQNVTEIKIKSKPMRKPTADLIKRITLVKCKELGITPDRRIYRRLKKAYNSMSDKEKKDLNALILKKAII